MSWPSKVSFPPFRWQLCRIYNLNFTYQLHSWHWSNFFKNWTNFTLCPVTFEHVLNNCSDCIWNMFPSRIVTLHYNTITNLGDTIIQRLFHQRYRCSMIRYNTENIVTLLNYITQHTTHIPKNIHIPWGDAIRKLSAPNLFSFIRYWIKYLQLVVFYTFFWWWFNSFDYNTFKP